MAVRIVLRRDTTVNWTLANPILADGELALDQDLDRLKAGDGITPWNELPFVSNGAGALPPVDPEDPPTENPTDELPTLANIPSLDRIETSPGVYPARGTTRADLVIRWKGSVQPPIAAAGSGVNFVTSATAMDNVDEFDQRDA